MTAWKYLAVDIFNLLLGDCIFLFQLSDFVPSNNGYKTAFLNGRSMSPTLSATEHDAEDGDTSIRATSPLRGKGGHKSDRKDKKSKSPVLGKKKSSTTHVEKRNVMYVLHYIPTYIPTHVSHSSCDTIDHSILLERLSSCIGTSDLINRSFSPFKAMSHQHVTCLTLLDLSAAFENINHSILLERLSSWFGISSTALSWIKSYLLNRNSFYVNIEYSKSSVFQLLY